MPRAGTKIWVRRRGMLKSLCGGVLASVAITTLLVTVADRPILAQAENRADRATESTNIPTFDGFMPPSRKRAWQEMLRRVDGSGKLRPDIYQSGFDHIQRMKAPGLPPISTPALPIIIFSTCMAGQWKQIGPAPETIVSNACPPRCDRRDSGEVVDIAVDPRGSSDSTIYVATNGGIWKTKDGGSNWSTGTDCLATVSMGAIALDAGNPDVVYAGTGNRNWPPLYGGGIVYQSPDGGGDMDALKSAPRTNYQ
jgi:hypothetical protein